MPQNNTQTPVPAALISENHLARLNLLSVVSTRERTSPHVQSNSRRIAEIQNELEELKNTVKQRSGSMVSRASSEYSDRPTFLTPEHSSNGAYSPGQSPYASPFSRTEDSFRGLTTGRIDTKSEDDLFLTYVGHRSI